jgi:hypothetical protein
MIKAEHIACRRLILSKSSSSVIAGDMPHHADMKGELLVSPHHRISPQIDRNPAPTDHADAELAPIKTRINARTTHNHHLIGSRELLS